VPPEARIEAGGDHRGLEVSPSEVPVAPANDSAEGRIDAAVVMVMAHNRAAWHAENEPPKPSSRSSFSFELDGVPGVAPILLASTTAWRH
jgi:hypothetical protein